MNFRKVLIAVVAWATLAAPILAGPPVEITSLAGPHGTAPQQWLQRLDEAGAGPTRLLFSGETTPWLDDLGTRRRGVQVA